MITLDTNDVGRATTNIQDIGLTKLQKTQINYVMKQIDFDRILSVCQFLELSLYPSVESLKDMAYEMLVHSSTGSYSSCGMFSARYDKKTGEFSLAFELASGESFCD